MAIALPSYVTIEGEVPGSIPGSGMLSAAVLLSPLRKAMFSSFRKAKPNLFAASTSRPHWLE